MAELYIFSQDDKLLTVLSHETGVIEAPLRDELNNMPDSPFVFSIYADEPKAKHVKEENQVVFKDREGDLRLYVIKELNDSDDINGPITEAICEPAFMELKEHIVVERRFVDKKAQEALNAALEGTRWTGVVEAELYERSTTFYYITAVDAIWKILDVWGGDFKDVVTFNNRNEITSRQIIIKQRLGADNGLRFEIDHNIEEIERTVLSYPLTAMYGRGASLEITDEEGEHTGGYTRYIDFADVEWKKSAGDPADKPLGQKWIGDPEALQAYGREHNGSFLHREGIFSNQDYEDPEELLRATWDALQEAKQPEVNYRLSVDLLDKPAELGDTAIAIDREFARPIEMQSRIIAIEYDVLDPDETPIVEMGQFLSANKSPGEEIDEIRQEINDNRPRWDQADKPIDNSRYPDIKPDKPVNVRTVGAFQTIQLYWDYSNEVYVSHYEVYGSQVADFVPDSQHLLWKGDVAAFGHEVETDQTWYYYIRAINYHDRASDFSDRVEASTVRIISDDILFGEDLAARLRDLSEVADIIADGSVSWEQISEQAKELIEYNYKEYTDEEIEAEHDRIMKEIADKYDDAIDYVDGQLVDKVDYSDYDTKVHEIAEDLADKADAEWVDGELVKKVDLSDYNLFLGDYEETIISIDERADGIARSISETNVRIDNLDIRGTNFITLLPENWEYGFYHTDDGEKHDSTHLIRLKNKYRIDPSKDYILSDYPERAADPDEYPETNLFLHLWNRDGSYSRYVVLRSSNPENWVHFQTSENEVQFSLHIMPYDEDNPLDPELIHTILYYKLAYGTEVSGWTPNLEDTGLLVANVQEYVTNFEQTAREIRADVSALEIDVSELGTNVSDINSELVVQADLIEGKVSRTDYQTDKNDIINQIENAETLISQNAEDITLRATKNELDNVEQEINNQMAQININVDGITSEVSNLWADFDGLEIGGRNLIAEENVLEYGNNTIIFVEDFPPNTQKLMLSMQDDRHKDSLTKIGILYIYGTGESDFDTFEITYDELPYHLDLTESGRSFIGFQANFDGLSEQKLLESKVKLEKGNKVTDWTPAPEDVQSEITSVRDYASSIEQTATSIRQDVSALERDVDAHGSSITDINSTLTQHAGMIEGKVSLVDYEADHDDIIDRFSAQETLIQQNYDSIVQRVENIQIGGRNLIKNSREDFIVEAKDTGYNYKIIYHNLERNSTFTFSAEVEILKGSFDVIDIYPYKASGQAMSRISVPIINDRIECTFTTDDRYDYNLLVYAGKGGETNNKSVKLTRYQLEKGSYATDWRPAEEDFYESIAEINVRADGIESTVSQVRGNLENTDAELSNLDSWVRPNMDLAFSEIIQLANDITLKVNKNTVVSEINLNPEGIRLKGSLIELDGTTLIREGVIGTAAIADAAITRAKLGRAVVDTAQIADAAITNAKIANVSADKINATSLSAITANLGSVTGGRITQESAGYAMEMRNGELTSYSGGLRTSVISGAGHEFYRVGTRIGSIGTAGLYSYPNLRGLNFQLDTDAYYMAWSHLERPNDPYYTIKLAWYKDDQAYDVKGFNFSDNIRLGSDYILYVRRFSTTNYSSGSRHIHLQNFTWNDESGVAFTRRESGSRLFLGSSNTAALINDGNAYIQVGENSSGNYVQSIDIWNRTSSNATNVRVGNSGRLYRTSSASKYKLLIENEEEKGFDYNRILDLSVKSWYDKMNTEVYSKLLSEGRSLNEEDIHPLKRHFGLIAEDVESVGLSEFVDYNDAGELEGIEYDRLWTLLIPVVRDLRNENKELKQQIKQLEEKIA